MLVPDSEDGLNSVSSNGLQRQEAIAAVQGPLTPQLDINTKMILSEFLGK